MTMWTEKVLERFLAEPRLRYQRISLPYGLYTPGEDRGQLLDTILEGDLAGKSVLDVGSFLGYSSLAACEGDAERVLGLEADPDRADHARTLAELRGLSPEFLVGDLERIEFGERFDIVLCLNVLHHFTSPLAALHKLMHATKDTLVLEVATFTTRMRQKLGVSRRQLRLLCDPPTAKAGFRATAAA